MTGRRILAILMAITMIVNLATWLPAKDANASSQNADKTATTWKIGEADTEATCLGPDEENKHLLKLDVALDASMLRRAESAIFNFTLSGDLRTSSNRKIAVWTNLSKGTKEEEPGAIGNTSNSTIAFPTDANVEAGSVVETAQIMPTDTSASVSIPLELLYDAKTGETATEIYLILCLNESGTPDYRTTMDGKEGGNRGAEGDKGFNSIVDGTLSLNVNPNAFAWRVTPSQSGATDVNVERMGTNEHVLELSLGLDVGTIRRGESATIQFDFSVAHNSSRRIVVWTDLSAEGDSVKDITFATSANIINGKVIVLGTAIANGDDSASIEIPNTLLYDEETGAATKLYALITTDKGENGEDADQYTIVGNNRGGDARAALNLDTEFDIFELITMTVNADPGTFDWKVSPEVEADTEQSVVRDASVTQVGTNNHVLKLGNLGITAGVLQNCMGDGTLTIQYTAEKSNSTRRLLAWTNLSGEATGIEDISFLETKNILAKKIAFSDAVTAGSEMATIKIPKELLCNSQTGEIATTIYFVMCTNKNPEEDVDALLGVGEHRGAGEFSRIDTIELAVTPAGAEETVYKHISITPGSDPSKLGFGWLTQAGTAKKAIVQLAKKADVIDGEMPENIYAFEGAVSEGAYGFDSNKVRVENLESGAQYVYRVGDGDTWSYLYDLTTYNPDGKYNIIAVADPQIGDDADALAWKKTMQLAMAKANSMGGASFMLSAGDQVNFANDYNEFIGYTAPGQLRNIPVAVAVGNHDTDESSLRVGDDDEPISFMPMIYEWPANSENAKPAESIGGWNYYFSYGNTLYIVINSNYEKPESDVHKVFMDEAIASHPDATWKIAMFHHDIYGGGSHASPTGYADSYRMQEKWEGFLDGYGVDLTVNGHDHIYARSQFIKNNKIEKYQRPSVLDVEETNIFTNNPGVYVNPIGIQYMALSGASGKFYALESQPWIAYGDVQTNKAQYSIITVDGDTLIFSTYCTETGELVDQITLRKKATEDDLTSLLASAKALEKGDISDDTWENFQDTIVSAEAADLASAHDSYMALYDAFYELEVVLDRKDMKELIDEVTEKLANSSEGNWEGQYPVGSMGEVQALLDEALVLYNLRLVSIDAFNEAYDALQARYDEFLKSVSDIPCPWVFIHEIPAKKSYMMDLIDWEKETAPLYWGADSKEHYNAHFIKRVYAKDIETALRTEAPYGPANDAGGRGHNKGHITETYIGEWVRYDLRVEEAGAYKAAIGAVNETEFDQIIVLRDDRQNVLTTFVIPANSALPAEGWSQAGMYEGSKEFYMPAGKYVIDLFFVNNQTAPAASNQNDQIIYEAGANVDVLKLERTGDMEKPKDISETDPNYFLLKGFNAAAGAPLRQRGWGTTGYEDEHGMVAFGMSMEVLKAANKLVVEVAAMPTNRKMQIALAVGEEGWIAAAPEPEFEAIFDPTLGDFGALVFDFETLETAKKETLASWLRQIDSTGRIILSYYGYGVEELNIMKAYLVLDEELNPCAEGHTPSENDCLCCEVCDGFIVRTCTNEEPCMVHNPEHVCYDGHTPKGSDCTQCENCDTVLDRTCTAQEPCEKHKEDNPVKPQDPDSPPLGETKGFNRVWISLIGIMLAMALFATKKKEEHK